MVTTVARIKAACLVGALQPSTLDALHGLQLTAAQWADADEIIAALDTHVDGDSNKRIHHNRLANCFREKAEDIDSWVISLRDLAAKCKFTCPASNEAYMEDRLLDMLTACINNTEILEKLLQFDDTKTLKDAVKLARAALTARCDAASLSHTNHVPITAAKLQGNPDRKPKKQQQDNKRQGANNSNSP
jgi:hypothetical protein